MVHKSGGKGTQVAAPGAPGAGAPSDSGLHELREALDGTRAADPDAAVPARWLTVCDGDERAARKRWREMAEWRHARGADSMLEHEQREFARIKRLFPHYWLGTDPSGNLVTLELMRDTRDKVLALRKAGISAERFASHQIFLTEFWVRRGLAPAGRVVRVIDVRDAPVISQVFGRVRMYFAPTSEAMSHYPDVTAAIYFVNASPTFRFAWTLLNAFLDERTRASIHIVDRAEDIPAGLLPETYTGGDLSAELQHVGMESALSRHARQVTLQQQQPSQARLGADASLAPAASSSSMGGLDSTEPAVVRGAEALLELLPGKWIVHPIESDPMDAVHRLQGLGYVARRAAALLPMSQVIAVAPDRASMRIVTTAGPVINDAEGALVQQEQQQHGEGAAGGGGGGDGDGAVEFHVLPRPQFLEEICCDTIVRVEFALPNGDKREVLHGIHRFSKDKKVMCVEYTSAAAGKSARAVLISHRKK